MLSAISYKADNSVEILASPSNISLFWLAELIEEHLLLWIVIIRLRFFFPFLFFFALGLFCFLWKPSKTFLKSRHCLFRVWWFYCWDIVPLQMVNLALSSWNILKLWFQFLFELYIHKCFVLSWETQFLLLPSATAFPRSIAGPHFSCSPQPPGAVWIQHGSSSSPPAPCPSYQSAWAAAAAALDLPHFFTSLLPINAIL